MRPRTYRGHSNGKPRGACPRRDTGRARARPSGNAWRALVADRHGDAPRPERALEWFEATGDGVAAAGAVARRRQAIALDAVPVAHDERRFTRRAAGRAAF